MMCKILFYSVDCITDLAFLICKKITKILGLAPRKQFTHFCYLGDQ